MIDYTHPSRPAATLRPIVLTAANPVTVIRVGQPGPQAAAEGDHLTGSSWS